ncbi:Hypothetical predicted protein [Lecanosticta acicola]|uniref:Uncharacterized protein n=1 Tax=Lecanosticta acicola TaxID=111012 RepID=A0AAI8YZB3_9PEZI|nr:Hypothetical predicted protein [Lecanosticta acicola]
MAEPAPLTAAHAHARRAAEETQQIHWSQAADEHEHAATDYARSARSTSDSEALRVLKLLEEQHFKLARIIRTQDAPLEQEETTTAEAKEPDPATSTHDFAQASKPPSQSSPKPTSTTSALAPTRIGSQARDSSPSLARDIASRRGIPQPGRTQPSAAAQARARQLSPESHRRNRSSAGPAPKIPPSVLDSQNLRQQASRVKKAEDDDAFAKFYSNLTTGTMSRLSSVLAYAGLPLTADDIQVDQPKPKLDKRTVSASNDPDVKKIFSKAALDAIEEDHRQRGAQGRVFGPAESFYVVQKGGGTYSYADIAKAQQQQQLGGIDEDDEESFVDAREAQAPASPKSSRVSHQNQNQNSRSSFGKSRTHEELELENTTLKATLETLAGRLQDFESHAQDASMAALTQSMVGLNHHRPGSNNAAAAAGNEAERVEQLEKQIEDQAIAQQKLEEQSARQEKMLRKYQAKWEDIKKSAMEKQKAKREKSERGGVEEESAAGPRDV